jgi:cysteine-rich repeat protein
VLGQTCTNGQLCQQSYGGCQPIATDCLGRAPAESFCDAQGQLATCGVDLTNVTSAACHRKCIDGQCDSSTCGDGAVQADFETCDDGNTVDGDGCSATCQIEDGVLGPPSSGATAVATGDDTCALFARGTVKCWGDNESGQLGIGTRDERGGAPGELADRLPRVDLGAGRTALQIASGVEFNCALLDDFTVKCWGENGFGQLAQGDTTDRGWGPNQLGDHLPPINLGTGRPARAISATDSYACALLDDGTAKCWGNVIGPYRNRAGFGPPPEGAIGSQPSQLGDSLPALELGTGRTILQLSIEDRHACALLDNRTVKCWGENDNGELGLGDRKGRGFDPSEMGDNLPAVDLGTGPAVQSVVAAYRHSCALFQDGRVKCWGEGSILGLGDNGYRGDLPGEMGDNLPFLDLGTGRSAKLLAAGGNHTCALLDDNSLKCWGLGSEPLGLGDATTRGDEPNEMGDNLPALNLGTGRTVRSLSMGAYHTCAVLDDASIKCWGSGGAQLGLGDLRDRGGNPGEMGDQLPPVSLVDY